MNQKYEAKQCLRKYFGLTYENTQLNQGRRCSALLRNISAFNKAVLLDAFEDILEEENVKRKKVGL